MTYIIKMKRFFCMLFVALLLISSISLISCSERRLYSEGDGELNVLCTVFAPFDFARIVGGERVKVTLLQEYLKKQELEADWDSSCAFGDSKSDLYIMNLVGNPIIVNGKRKLKKAAPHYPQVHWA